MMMMMMMMMMLMIRWDEDDDDNGQKKTMKREEGLQEEILELRQLVGDHIRHLVDDQHQHLENSAMIISGIWLDPKHIESITTTTKSQEQAEDERVQG